MATNEHKCPYAWCRSTFSCQYEHFGEGEVQIGQHCPDVDRIACYAYVTTDDDYCDEISFYIYGKETASASLTDDEATQLRDLLNKALANRAEIRGRATA